MTALLQQLRTCAGELSCGTILVPYCTPITGTILHSHTRNSSAKASMGPYIQPYRTRSDIGTRESGGTKRPSAAGASRDW